MSAVPTASNVAALSALMFAAGLGIPLMATLNAGLGQHLGSAVAATFVLFGFGLIIAASLLVAVGPPPRDSFASTPWYFYAAAIPMLLYIVSVTYSAPRIGLGNAIFLVLIGQIVAAAAIDQFGLFGAITTTVTPRRLAGILIMACGVYLARKPR